MPEKRPHEMTLHGHTRVDEYYWLRDDSRTNPEVIGYLEEENRYAEQVLAHTAGTQGKLYEELIGRLVPDEAGVPYRLGEYWYYYRYAPGDDYPIHARRKGSMDGEEEILINTQVRSQGHEFYALRGHEFSDDNRYMAIAEDTLGRRINEIRIYDTHTGKFLPEVIGNASDQLAWSADGQYLFYIDKHLQTLLEYRVMRHKLGTDASEDALVYEETDPTFYTWLWRGRSKDYIHIYHQNTDTTETQLLRADDPLGTPQPFLPRETGHEYDVDHADGRFFIRTNWQAENFRVMTAALEDARDKSNWREVVPHRDDAMVISLQAFDQWLVLDERENGLRKIRVRSHDASLDRYLDAPEEAYVMWAGSNHESSANAIRYLYSSPSTPEQTWEVDPETGASALLKARRVRGGFKGEDYRTARRTVTGRDGTEVPVTLVHNRDTALDGTAPAVIYGYGSYGASLDPWFDSSIISLLDRGFIYVTAHIRGGQELGRQWYENGRLLNKKNSFYDFIDVTRGLQQQDVIDPARTYAWGASAGGLLMGAVVNMAPELYHGVINEVAFVDVVTTMLDASIPLTSGEWREWGDPNDKLAYDYMLSYSPYDQVSAQAYPNLYITAGLHDSQVQYYEPAKWVARLRDRRTDDNRLVFVTDMGAGHGGQYGRYEQHRKTARQYAFLIDLAGIER